PAMARYRCSPVLLAVLEPTDARQIAADTTGEMRHLDFQGRKLIEQTAVDEPHGRDHQGEFPTQHAAEVVRIHLRPCNDLRQWMDENIESKIGARFPERAKSIGVKRLSLQLRCDDHARESKFDDAALELCNSGRRIERGHMRKSNEAAGVIKLRPPHMIVDQPAGGEAGLVEACAAGEDCNIDAGTVHHLHMGGKVSEQRIELVIWI